MSRRFSRSVLAALLALPGTASATFHLMQIEQVIGGVEADTDEQAIQLRMRAAGQNLVNSARLIARDAAGNNPVTVLDFDANVANAMAGAHVLIATADFATAPDVLPDFLMDAAIPESYLAAGRLTFEDTIGTVYWSLCWGGAGYTGPTTGAFDNDADGDFGPCYAGPLPSATRQALQFTGTAGAASTNNAADYALTFGDAVFTNNVGSSGTVFTEDIFEDGFEGD